MRRTPMKRSAWPGKPAMTLLQALDEARPVLHPTPKVTTRAVMVPVSQVPAAPVLKDEPVRSEAYRRLVVLWPCVICGVAGYSQAAHGSEGKGMGIKASDLELFPACADRPGVRGCHSLLDQGALFTKDVRHTLEKTWAADQRRRIEVAGLWPADLPKWSES
jgi:hypothetical protein